MVKMFTIASFVKLIIGSHDIDDPQFAAIFKPITVKDYSWVCTGATILQGITIGYGAGVYASVIVIKDVSDMEIVAKIHAPKIGTRNVKSEVTVLSPPFLH